MSIKIRNYYLTRIIYTILFLIFTTFYWYFNLKDINYQTANNLNNIKTISFNNLKQVSDSLAKDLTPLKVNIKNEEERREIKIFIVPTTTKISNNYIKYQINDEDIHSLNLDGMIYLDNLNPNEERNLTLKLWISENYQGYVKYSGNIVII